MSELASKSPLRGASALVLSNSKSTFRLPNQPGVLATVEDDSVTDLQAGPHRGLVGRVERPFRRARLPGSPIPPECVATARRAR